MLYSEKFANGIYRQMCRYHSQLECIPRDDVMQEIRIALLTCEEDNVWEVSQRNIRQLLKMYGYSELYRIWSGELCPHRLESMSEPTLTQEQEELIDRIEELYVVQNLSGKDVALYFGRELTPSISNCLQRCFPKYRQGKAIPYTKDAFDKIRKRIGGGSIDQAKNRWKFNGYIPHKYAKYLV